MHGRASRLAYRATQNDGTIGKSIRIRRLSRPALRTPRHDHPRCDQQRLSCIVALVVDRIGAYADESVLNSLR